MGRANKWGRNRRQHSKGKRRPRSWHRKDYTPTWLIENKLKRKRKRQQGNDDEPKADDSA